MTKEKSDCAPPLGCDLKLHLQRVKTYRDLYSEPRSSGDVGCRIKHDFDQSEVKVRWRVEPIAAERYDMTSREQIGSSFKINGCLLGTVSRLTITVCKRRKLVRGKSGEICDFTSFNINSTIHREVFVCLLGSGTSDPMGPRCQWQSSSEDPPRTRWPHKSRHVKMS
nr:hypothetical protein CFP56_69644 [Quercus suber]